MNYIKQLFDINSTYLLYMNSEKVVFEKILSTANKILRYVFGVIFQPYEKSGYVLKHLYRFRNSKFHPITENEEVIAIREWPCLEYTYVLYDWDRLREQLFDLQADPGEMVNLATAASHADVLNDHRRRLADWCQRTGDDPRPWSAAAT